MRKFNSTKALTLFIITGFLGYFFEVFLDKIFGNGGTGISYFGIPFLPLYAIAGLIVYAISKIKIKTGLKILFSTISIVGLELVTGLFLLSKDIRLWNYSNQFLNFKGLISLQVSLVWALMILIFYYVVLPYFDL